MLVSLPVLLPFLTGVLLLLVRGAPGLRWRRVLATGSLLLQLAVAGALLVRAYTAGIQVAHLGAWKEPLGIVLVGDKTAAILVVLALLVTLAATLCGFAEQTRAEESPLRQPLVQFLLTGIQLSFITGDLFNLFVAFEVMLLSSYGLLTLEARGGRMRQAYPYIVLNLISSMVFLAGCGYAYGLFGTLNFAGIAQAAAALEATAGGAARITVLTALLAFVFALKAGMFPLYYWLPNSYPVLPPSLGALYSGLLTKVGIYVLLRLLGSVMPHTQDTLYLLIAWLGGGTMLFGVLGAVSRNSMREILAFHVLSQVGFMILAIGFFTPLAFAAAIFYIIHHILVKATLFLTATGALHRFGTDDLKHTGGLLKAQPVFASGFLLAALSLAGLPPLSGFWAKLWILFEGLRGGWYALVAISLVTSVLTLASMLKIWSAAFWRPAPAAPADPGPPDRALWLSIGLLTAASLAVVAGVQPLWAAAQAAALELMEPARYFGPVLQALSAP